MLTAVRTVTFTVTASGVKPVTPQWAGVQGEHHATEVVFKLPAEWEGIGYRFRVEWVDGMQATHVSDWLTAADNAVSVLLPQAWTAAGGIGEMRLAAVLEAETAASSQTVYSNAARLSFMNRNRID